MGEQGRGSWEKIYTRKVVSLLSHSVIQDARVSSRTRKIDTQEYKTVWLALPMCIRRADIERKRCEVGGAVTQHPRTSDMPLLQTDDAFQGTLLLQQYTRTGKQYLMCVSHCAVKKRKKAYV